MKKLTLAISAIAAAFGAATSHKICCATTMSGKPCRFKAVCGDYCRKHRVSSTSIGNKVDVSDLLSKLDGIKIN